MPIGDSAADRAKRDAALDGLERIERLDSESSVDRRIAVRRALQQGIAAAVQEDRAAMLFHLLSAAPNLIARIDAAYVVRPRELFAAVRAERPPLFLRRFGRGLTDAIVAALYVVAPMAVVVANADIAHASSIFGDAVINALSLACVCFLGSLPLAVAYLPSVGGHFRKGRDWIWKILYGFLAGLAVVAAAALLDNLSSSPSLIGLWGEGDHSGTLPFLGVAAIANTIVLFGIRPAYEIGLEKFPVSPRMATVAISAGPAILFTTLVCGIAALNNLPVIAECWPRVTASIIAAALTVFILEASAWPRRTKKKQRPYGIALFAIAAGLPWLMAIGGIVSTHRLPASATTITIVAPKTTSTMVADVVTERRIPIGIEGEKPPPIRLSMSARKSLDILSREKVEPGNNGDFKLSFQRNPRQYESVTLYSRDVPGLDISTVPLWAFPDRSTIDMKDPESLPQLSNNVNFQFRPDLVLCVNACESEPKLPSDQNWLRVLTRGPQQLAEVTITAQSSSINALMPPIGEIDLPIGKTVHESIPAGASFPLHLPDFAELEVKVDGKGSFGTAAAISMFDPKAGHFVIWPGERRSEKVLRVPPGQYVVCAYFGVADFPVCDPRQKGAHVIETGLAEVDFSNQLKMAAGTVTVGSAPVEEDLGLAFGASLPPVPM